jgi:hypothetical protein
MLKTKLFDVYHTDHPVGRDHSTVGFEMQDLSDSKEPMLLTPDSPGCNIAGEFRAVSQHQCRSTVY